MFFKRRDSGRDISDIKDAMEKTEETYLDAVRHEKEEMVKHASAPRPAPVRSVPHESHEERPAPPRIHPPHPLNPQPQPQSQMRITKPDVAAGAPLFVKVEKYREILVTLQEMKLFVSGMKQLFNVLNEMETVRSDAINIMRATVQRLEKSMVEVDQELLRPRGLNFGELSSGHEITHIEDTLGELQKQLSDVRKELQGMQ